MTEISNISDLPIHVIDTAVHYDQYVAVDLSVFNTQLASIRLNDPKDFGTYIEDYLARNSAAAAYGGYDEQRNLYRTSSIFTPDDAEERNIHIGLDIWLGSGTPVLAAFDGIVHSFANNTGAGNYGPTIILQHEKNGKLLYTLYGHLSLDSIHDLAVGTIFRQGDQIATLGDAHVNGGYPPHLHFQVIKDIGTYSGDYPGVCSPSERVYYLENCPDPNLLLKIK